MDKNHIYNIYTKAGMHDTDIAVAEAINHYINKNISVLTDALVKYTPVISEATRIGISKHYGITEEYWKEIKKSSQFPLMGKLASDLKLGLLVSYFRTRYPIYLNFLSILFYTSATIKFFPRGYDRAIMKFTVDGCDDRVDFKKFAGNLILIVNKKNEVFIQSTLSKIKGIPTDKDIRETLQAVSTRVSNMLQVIASKYYENFKDPDLKIQMRYMKDAEGNEQMGNMGVFDAIRNQAVDNIAYVSDKYLDAVGLGARNVDRMRYRLLFISKWKDVFPRTSKATTMLLDEWIMRNKDSATLKNFRLKFVKEMSVARWLDKIRDEIDIALYEMLEDIPKERHKEYNKMFMHKTIFRYLLLNLHYTALMIK